MTSVNTSHATVWTVWVMPFWEQEYTQHGRKQQRSSFYKSQENLSKLFTQQFGFREQHSTIQIHRVTKVINEAMQKKQYCSEICLDIRQAFDKVWYRRLLYKIKKKTTPSVVHPTTRVLRRWMLWSETKETTTQLYPVTKVSI